MHLTTIVSLLAVGAAAAPAKSWSLNTKISKSTLSNLGLPSATGILDDLPKAPEVTSLVRRQDDGEDTPEESSSTSSSSSSTSTSEAAGLIPELPSLPLRRRQGPTPTGEAAAKKDPLDEYLDTLKGDYNDELSEKALDHYHESLEEDDSTVTTSTSVVTQTPVPETVNSMLSETKNETSSAVPEPTKKAASSDPLARLNGALPIKRQDLPEVPEPVVPEVPTLNNVVKRQLGDLMGSVPEVEDEEVATPEVSEKNVTTPAVPAVSEEQAASTTTDAQNVTSSAVDNTTAQASSSAADGFHGINKHMAKLDKLPIGGLPIKRQVEDVTEAVPKVDEEDLAAPEDITAPSTPTVDEKQIDSQTAAVNETTSVVEDTSADASSTAAAGYHQVKHVSKLDSLPLGGLPVKRQAPDFLIAPVDTPEVADYESTGSLPDYLSTPTDVPEVANPQPTGGLPTEPNYDTIMASHDFTEAYSSFYKHLVPLQRQNRKPTSEVTGAAPFELPEEMNSFAPVEKRDTVSETTEEVSPDTDAVEAPEVAAPDTGLDGLLGGLA
jgi:hypothetical protein